MRGALWLLPLVAGCTREPSGGDTTPSPSTVTPSTASSRVASPWPSNWAPLVGKLVTLEGTAVDSKLGAELLGDERSIGIADLSSWPKGFYRGGSDGKRVRVTGTVAVRSDVPAFVARPGELPRAGVPVDADADLDEARKRFVLEKATWEIVP